MFLSLLWEKLSLVMYGILFRYLGEDKGCTRNVLNNQESFLSYSVLLFSLRQTLP